MTGIPDVGAIADMSVREMVDATPLAGILDRPVGDVLADLGLPPLPALPELPPLPGLPPLPVIDLGLLIKPLTDLVGGFGSGDLGGAHLDPSTILSGLAAVLETSLGLGKAALDVLDQVWVGAASMGAAAKTAEAGTNSAALSAQGAGMSFDMQAAAGIVGAGLATLQGIIAATVAKLTATIPVITTPAGSALAVAFATEGLAEGAAVVAATRAQLLAPTMHMTTNGAPVPVTGAPVMPQSPFAVAGTILDAVSPVLSTVVSLPSTLAGPLSAMGYDTATLTDSTPSAATVPASLRGAVDYSGPDSGGGSGGVGGVGALGGPGGLGTPLSAARPSAPTMEPAAATGPAAPRNSSTTTAPVATPMAPMAPMGALGGARTAGAGAGGEAHELPDYLVTEDHGERVVGEDEPVAPAVFGAQAAPPSIPDIALRLLPMSVEGANAQPAPDDSHDRD